MVTFKYVVFGLLLLYMAYAAIKENREEKKNKNKEDEK